MSVVLKESKVDGEQVLYDHLYPKFGKRFLNYRSKYENYLKDNKHNSLPDYPISVILELVNRCNLECTMCFQGYRNDAKKSTLQLSDLKNLLKISKKINWKPYCLVPLNHCFIKILIKCLGWQKKPK